MTRALLGAVCGIAILPAMPARAEAPVAEMPKVKVGSSWDYAGGAAAVPCKHWVFTGVEDGYAIAQCEGFKSFTSLETGNVVRVLDKDGDKVVQFSPSATFLSFPLKVGKSWEFSYSGYTAADGAQWDGKERCAVKAFETVTVAAGQFDAFRIECAGEWTAGPAQGKASSTSWWSPKAEATVKTVNPDAPKWNLELTGYALK
jgi:hypothetical protein